MAFGRSKSLPPLRTQARDNSLPSDMPPILEQSGDNENDNENNNENENDSEDIIASMNGRLSSLENLLKSFISSLSDKGSEPSLSDTGSSSISLLVPVNDNAELTVPKPTEQRFVSRRNYNSTSKSVIDTFVANNITMECKDSFVRISLIRGALSTAGLRNMIDGHRTQPLATIDNPNGYRERSIQKTNVVDEITGESRTITILLEEDDIYYYEYDKGRLYQAILEIFHKSLLYLVPAEIEANDGVTMYTKIMEHLNGQRGRDADIAREAFVKYRMNESITFKQERAKFEEVFKTLEYAQRSKIPESEKIQFLNKRLMLDKRVGLKDVMVQSRCNDFSYDKTIELLIKVN